MGVRVVPNETIPRQAYRILLPHERQVITVRLRFRRPVIGRLLGYGQFILHDAGGGRGQLRVNFLPYPEQLCIEVLGLLFPDRESGD